MIAQLGTVLLAVAVSGTCNGEGSLVLTTWKYALHSPNRPKGMIESPKEMKVAGHLKIDSSAISSRDEYAH